MSGLPDLPALPVGSWDCHAHIFGPWADYPLPPAPAYQPDAAPFSALRALHAQLGIGHGVLVQGACYGLDHAALLGALEQGQGKYRGIAIIAPDIEEAMLAGMHARGVRGVRFNFMSHLPGATDPARFAAVVERIRPYGWHVLLHGGLPDILGALPTLTDLNVPVLIDHMARVKADEGVAYPAFGRLERLLALPQIWIKLSGADRIAGRAPYTSALPVMRRLLEIAPERCLWGSDWPHVNISGQPPAEAALLQLLYQACGSDAGLVRQVLVDNPARLYA